MRSLLYFCLALLVGVTGCAKDDSQPDINLPALPAGSVADVTLKYGETAATSLDGGAARVEFVTVREGRCATEDCYRCLGGYATVTVKVQLQGSSAQTLLFDCLSCQQQSTQTPPAPVSPPQKLQGYTISLIDITDYSRVATVRTGQYVIRLRIAK